ncbi:MAG TPA: OmpH family outer membrane protein [Saprospiraceae bacterium]|nr:OmpH family outer membrane protein [Saprospiraceae bacterium]
MNKIIKIGMLLVAMITITSTIQAQKFGYVNSQAILAEMAEVKQARAKLEALGKQLEKKGQQMVTAFQTDYQALADKEKKGILSPKQLQEEANKLKEREAKIGQYQQDMQRQLAEKEQTELKPILDKVNNAIKAVAKEDGYQFIFDSSTNVILFADESSDVTAKVKAKL